MNMYIKAMEIGYESNDGIMYSHLKLQIENSLNIEISGKKETSFAYWVLQRFDGYEILKRNNEDYWYTEIINREDEGNIGNISEIGFFSELLFMKGSTTKEYLDYLELKESRKQSKDVTQVEKQKEKAEIARLKDELYKADLLIRLYEKDMDKGTKNKNLDKQINKSDTINNPVRKCTIQLIDN